MYSEDLRSRVISYYYNNNDSYRRIADIFKISIATISRWLNGFKPTERKSKFPANFSTIVENIICDLKPFFTISDIKHILHYKYTIIASIGKIFYTVRSLGYTSKKVKSKPHGKKQRKNYQR